MKNYVKPAKVITFIADIDYKSGDGVSIGEAFGVSAYDVLTGKEGEMETEGQFKLPKAAGAGSGSTQFQAAYWDASTKKVTETVGSNKKIGYYAYATQDADLTADVVIFKH